MLRAAVLAFEQLSDPAIQRLVLRCVLLALTTFVALVIAVATGLTLFGVTGIGWLDTTLAFAGSGLALVIAWLLFPLVVTLTLNAFAEDVAHAVERRHYPELPPAAPLSFADASMATVRLTAVTLLLNLLALPFYLIPGANLVLYLALNGYLLGREYFEVVVQRRLSLRGTRTFRRAVRGRLWLGGVVIAALLLVPLVNLIAPVVATAFMVHLVERWRRRDTTLAKAEEARSLAVPPTGDGSI